MKNLIILIIVLSGNFCFGQQKVLDGFNFLEEDYQIFIQDRQFYGDSAKKLGLEPINTFIEDRTTINDLKEKWQGEFSEDYTWCGYTHNLYLIKQDSIQKRFSVNIDCGYVVVNGGEIHFDGNPFENLNTKSKAFCVAFPKNRTI